MRGRGKGEKVREFPAFDCGAMKPKRYLCLFRYVPGGVRHEIRPVNVHHLHNSLRSKTESIRLTLLVLEVFDCVWGIFFTVN